jgi:hypothetical protein
MIEELSTDEKEVAQAKAKVRLQTEEYCLLDEEAAAIDEVSPIPGLRERPVGVIGGR